MTPIACRVICCIESWTHVKSKFIATNACVDSINWYLIRLLNKYYLELEHTKASVIKNVLTFYQ